MIYLDNSATSLHKPVEVGRAVNWALRYCANPGRGGHKAAMDAAEVVYQCRELAGEMFHCQPEQVVFTSNCTHGLNIAIHSLVKPGSAVAVTGFEHNAVVRPLYARGVKVIPAGRKLFDWEDTLEQFEKTLKGGVSAAVFTQCSNVFGYILPVEEMAKLCRSRGIPFIIDAAQSAGVLPISLEKLGADFIAMPGHKGLLGPQGTGILLCAGEAKPLMQGGTGSHSQSWEMPRELPDMLEAGTLNVPGIAGLGAGLQWLKKTGIDKIFCREKQAAEYCSKGLQKLGYHVFLGEKQSGTVSFTGKEDCEEIAAKLAKKGIAVRAGLHCAPLAHESAGTLKSGTVRISFGHDAKVQQADAFLNAMKSIV
jgi:selenocysteine lyase/cysteine desulfurase